MCRQIREIIRIFVADRSGESAKELWSTFPYLLFGVLLHSYRQMKSILGGLSSKRHHIINKGRRETHHLKRFNHTLRQRVSI